MRQIRDRVGGIDVHRDFVLACARVPGPRGGPVAHKRKFATTTGELSELADWLLDQQVRHVVMEATGVYWKSVYYALEGLFEQVELVNAAHVKNVPGRKSDVSDAEWLADVAAHGMVRASFVPPAPIRELRELTRYRRTQSQARAREIQRLDKVLQDAGIKLSSVTSRVLTKSGRDMIEALIRGEQDPGVLAEMARRGMRSKIPQLQAALTGRFGAHHAVLARQILDHVDFLDLSIGKLTEQIDTRLRPFAHQIELLTSIPGIKEQTAQVIIAETGGDMSRFPTAKHLAAWAGLAPASHESAGKRRPAGTRHGTAWLRQQLIEAAHAAAHSKTSYFAARYRRLGGRRNPNKAAVAVAHSLIVTIWHVLTEDHPHQDLGRDFHVQRFDPAIETKQLIARLNALGHQVTLTPAA